MPLDRVPDAITYPHGVIGGDLAGRLLRAKHLWGPVLKAPRVYVICDPLGFNLALPLHKGREHEDPGGLYFPFGHPMEKQDRFTWYVAVKDGRGGWQLGELCQDSMDKLDAVRFGYAIPDPAKVDAAVARSVEEELARRAADKHQRVLRQLTDDPALRARYQAGLALSDEQMDARYPRLEPRPDGDPAASSPDV